MLLQHNIDDAVAKLWSEFYEYLTTLSSYSLTIYVHSLGGFDGIFIFKYLASISNDPSMVDTIIDGSNKFITISYNGIVFKDSYRVFPHAWVSLQELCGIFNVTGKSNVYKEEYSNIQVFSNPALLQEFISYGMQDSIALYNALVKAQELYHSKYQVDITTIVSLPALALKIFRMKFLDKLIPILNGVTDRFIRNSYYGGAVDFYKATNIHAENLYYYDVNSLYPYAMLKPMPMNLIRSYNDKECKDINLDNFFGFLEVDVECSDSISKPVLPVKYLGKTIYPKGSWTATYFSQELKEVMKLGYTVSKIHKAYEFDSDILFHDYIMEMYQLKKYAKGGMHENDG